MVLIDRAGTLTLSCRLSYMEARSTNTPILKFTTVVVLELQRRTALDYILSSAKSGPGTAYYSHADVRARHNILSNVGADIIRKYVVSWLKHSRGSNRPVTGPIGCSEFLRHIRGFYSHRSSRDHVSTSAHVPCRQSAVRSPEAERNNSKPRQWLVSSRISAIAPQRTDWRGVSPATVTLRVTQSFTSDLWLLISTQSLVSIATTKYECRVKKNLSK